MIAENVICSAKIDGGCEATLNALSINVIKLNISEKYRADEVSFHPDMLCFCLKGNKWIFYEDIYDVNKDKIDPLDLDIIKIPRPENNSYPYNTELNAAAVGKNLFCLQKYTNPNILHSGVYDIINVKQGYAKCSVCVVDDNSIITADIKIHEKARERNINSLLIRQGDVKLNGYGYGFIGGAAGKITLRNGNDSLVFFGNAEKHGDYDKIAEFCRERRVKIISLTDRELYDFGGFLPVL